MTAAAWELVRNWLGTIGTISALLIAAFTYRRNIKIKREEQARLVYSKITHVEYHEVGALVDVLPNGARIGNRLFHVAMVPHPYPDEGKRIAWQATAPLLQATAVIHNGSKELIGPARIQLVNRGRKNTWDDFSIDVGVIDPESEYVVNFIWINEDHPGEPSLGTTVIFRDASGEWWRRHLAEPIEHVHNDPENSGPTPKERVSIREQQVGMGYEPIKEPKVRWRVRWYRYWRKRRGKAPLP
ncbi:hypothetical protein [Lentzea sp. NEAU-D7]|uniref:hypothetical protein n=1 Tax=Lentzea sp. NEAU-D7 TaxID=2994667 RepID=UPI00224A66D5|nr:hypothetical protein [Lentzea sp. NEAU-D7]MCX2950877.1 hypothetical protein [Lentzea sp. NEAU-D7]